MQHQRRPSSVVNWRDWHTSIPNRDTVSPCLRHDDALAAPAWSLVWGLCPVSRPVGRKCPAERNALWKCSGSKLCDNCKIREVEVDWWSVARHWQYAVVSNCTCSTTMQIPLVQKWTWKVSDKAACNKGECGYCTQIMILYADKKLNGEDFFLSFAATIQIKLPFMPINAVWALWCQSKCGKQEFTTSYVFFGQIYPYSNTYIGRRSKYRIVAGLCTLEECGHLLHKRRSLPGQGYKRQTFDILNNNKYELIWLHNKKCSEQSFWSHSIWYMGAKPALCVQQSRVTVFLYTFGHPIELRK